MLRINVNFHGRTSSAGRALEREVEGSIPGTGQTLLERKVLPSRGSDDLVKWRSRLQ